MKGFLRYYLLYEIESLPILFIDFICFFCGCATKPTRSVFRYLGGH